MLTLLKHFTNNSFFPGHDSVKNCPVLCIPVDLSLWTALVISRHHNLLCLTILESQHLCSFLFAWLRGRTGRRMVEGSRSVQSVWWEHGWFPRKHGVPVHIDPNPESSSRKASRDCHTNLEEKEQTPSDSWCQRYLQATKRPKGKSKFLAVISSMITDRRQGQVGVGGEERKGRQTQKGYFQKIYVQLFTSFQGKFLLQLWG